MFTSTAWAQDAAAATGSAGIAGMAFSYMPILLIFVIFYFLIIRPQGQAAKQHAALLAALKRGDVVLTDGGLVGEITHVSEGFVQVRLNHDNVVSVARPAIRKVLTGDAAKGWEPAAEGKKR